MKTNSRMWVLGALAFLVLSTTLQSRQALAGEIEAPSAYADQFETPDPQVLAAAQRGVEAYRDTRQFKTEWKITTDSTKGIIETNWYPEHKGEVRLKVQVAVWGKHYHVDVWHKIGFMFKKATKTEISRRIERQIQEEIAGVMSQAAKE